MCVAVCKHTFGGHADPVEVAGEFPGHVRLAPSRQTHHDNDGGWVGEVGSTTCCGDICDISQLRLFAKRKTCFVCLTSIILGVFLVPWVPSL